MNMIRKTDKGFRLMIFFMAALLLLTSVFSVALAKRSVDAANYITIYFDTSYTGWDGSSHSWSKTMENVYYHAFGSGGKSGNNPVAMTATGENGKDGGKLFRVKINFDSYQKIIISSVTPWRTGSNKDKKWQTANYELSSSDNNAIFKINSSGINDPNDDYYMKQKLEVLGTYTETVSTGQKWALANYTSASKTLTLKYLNEAGDYLEQSKTVPAKTLAQDITVPPPSNDKPEFTKVEIYDGATLLKSYKFSDGKIPGDQSVNGNVFIYGVTQYATDKLDEGDRRTLCYWHARCDSTNANKRKLYFSNVSFPSTTTDNITVTTSAGTYSTTPVTTDGNASFVTTDDVVAGQDEVITVQWGSDLYHMVWDKSSKNLISKPYDAAIISGKYSASSTFTDSDGSGITVDSEFFDYKYSSGTGSNNYVTSEDPYGSYKRPYYYINEAISHSDYAAAFNNTSYNKTLNNDSIKNKPPMYLGGFWSSGNAQDVFNDTYAANETSAHSEQNPYGSKLTGFRYAANLAYRPYQQQSGDSFYYNTVAQGLVDSKLSGNKEDGYTLTANGKNVPYFDYEWWSSQTNYSALPNYLRYADNVPFPFYTVNGQDVNINNTFMLTPNDYHKVYSGTYYVFDSAKDVLRVHMTNSTTTRKHNAQDSEAVFDGYGNGTDSNRTQRGIFPFNDPNYTDSNDTQHKNINYGFGIKYNFDFYLNETGTLNGEVDGIPITFTFKGDDDVWVFLDDKLILDMGGDHKEAVGEINFATKSIYISQAGAANTNLIEERTKNCTVDGSYLSSETNPSVSTINKPFYDSSIGISLDSAYLKTGKHRLTMYYMERGMFNSNLYVMFNLPQDTTMWELQEDTDFGNINTGFTAAAKMVADTDVFNYSVENKGTDNSGMTSNYRYPTYDAGTRQNTELAAQNNTALNGYSGTPPAPITTTVTHYLNSNQDPNKTYLYLDPSQTLEGTWHWTDANAQFAAHFFNDSNGTWDIYATKDNVSGYYYVEKPSGYNKIIWLRLNPNGSGDIWSKEWNRTDNLTIPANGNNLFILNGVSNTHATGNWSTYTDKYTESQITYPTGAYTTNDFAPANQTAYQPLMKDSSTGVTYMLTDPFCSAGSFMKNTRSMNGSDPNIISLQYGQMATFRKQFTHNSDMRVTQLDALSSVVNNSNQKTIVNGYTEPAAQRTVSKYYDTYIKTRSVSGLTKTNYAGLYNGNDLIGTPLNVVDTTGLYDDKFNYSNNSVVNLQYEGTETTYKFLDPSDSTNKNVYLRQVFVNSVKTADLTIRKDVIGETDTSVDQNFTFTITFSNVFGASYGDSQIGTIPYTKIPRDGSANTSGSISNGGSVTFQAGDRILIEDIPVGTKYYIAETGTGSDFELDSTESIGIGSSTDLQELDGDITAVIKNTRKRGQLALSKIVYDESETNIVTGVTAEFPITFSLTSVSGVDITGYPLKFKWNGNDLSADKLSVTTSGSTITVTAMIKPNSALNGADQLIVSGIPFGTTYAVSEGNVPAGYVVFNGAVAPSGFTKDPSGGNIAYNVSDKTIGGTIDTAGNTGKVYIFNKLNPIVMPSTGGTPLIWLLPFGIIALALSGGALVIYKRKLQSGHYKKVGKGRSE